MFATVTLAILFAGWLFYSLLMKIVRMFTRTTKKTLHVLAMPYPRKR